MAIRADLFSYLQDFLLRQSGLVLADDKVYLIRSRAQALLRKYKVATLDKLVEEIKRNEKGEMAHHLIDAMTTNETLFFRDTYPFEALDSLIFPELIRGNPKSSIRIWSAASSRGQEAYSIAMTAAQAIPMAAQRVKILGTDLSESAVAYAIEGVYSPMEVKRGMEQKQLTRFFKPQKDDWAVNDVLRNMVHFEEGNLVDDQLVHQVRKYGPFDIVFCRNVLIYFSPEERKKVIDRLARAMKRGGYLLTGATEVPEGNMSRWECVMFKNKRLWKLL